MPRSQPDHTLEEVLAAVARGHTVTGTAHLLEVTRPTMYSYCRRWATVAQAIEDERTSLVDLGELGLRKHLQDSQPWAIAFALRTLGKDRGYTERHEHTGPDGGDIPVMFTIRIDRANSDENAEE